MGFNLFELSIKVTMGINSAFGRSGTSGRKENGRRIIPTGSGAGVRTCRANAGVASSVRPPQNQRRPTVTQVLTVLKNSG